MTFLLVYGTDQSLLQTRSWVLKEGGFEVFIATSSVEVESSLKDQALALLILCHSLSLEDCQQALALAGTLSPQAKTLLLASRFSRDLNALVDTVFDPFEGPAALIHFVRKITGVPVGS